MKIAAMLLAGGQGVRMKSDIPKPLVELRGEPLLGWALNTLRTTNLEQKIVVAGHKAEMIMDRFNGCEIDWVIQPEPKGNGDALALGLSRVRSCVDTILTLYPDSSLLYKPTTIERFVFSHKNSEAVVSFISVEQNHPAPKYKIVSERNQFIKFEPLSEKEKGTSKHLFTGCACFKRDWLLERVGNIPVKENETEISLPTLFDMAREEYERVNLFKLLNSDEWGNVNTPEQLRELEGQLRSRKEIW